MVTVESSISGRWVVVRWEGTETYSLVDTNNNQFMHTGSKQYIAGKFARYRKG